MRAARVVLHRAGAERIELLVDREVLRRQVREVPHHLELGHRRPARAGLRSAAARQIVRWPAAPAALRAARAPARTARRASAPTASRFLTLPDAHAAPSVPKYARRCGAARESFDVRVGALLRRADEQLVLRSGQRRDSGTPARIRSSASRSTTSSPTAAAGVSTASWKKGRGCARSTPSMARETIDAAARGARMAVTGDAGDALVAHERHVDRAGGDQQALVRADVRRRLAAADVLLARLQGQRVADAAVEVDGAADDPPRHLPHERLSRRRTSKPKYGPAGRHRPPRAGRRRRDVRAVGAPVVRAASSAPSVIGLTTPTTSIPRRGRRR